MVTMEELFTPEDLARILKMTEYTVRTKLKSGEIEGFKVGGRWRVKQEALRNYLDKQAKHKEEK